MWDEWARVKSSARGSKRDYRLDGGPLGEGGQATVVAGTHRETGIEVAFKRIKPGLIAESESRARMRREIDLGKTLKSRFVMPVLDSDDDATWFVMPVAMRNLEADRALIAADLERLRRLVRNVCIGLRAAHRHNWVHRDVKPANILRFQSEKGGRWVVADWGLGKGPAGATTHPGRTQVGTPYGTQGFAAPELTVNAHVATPAADIYSVGQLIGWVLNGSMPLANIAHLPTSGPWRTIVDSATRFLPQDRPQSVDDFLALVDDELTPLVDLPAEMAQTLVEQIKAGDKSARLKLFQLADANHDDVELFVDELPDVDTNTIKAIADGQPELLVRVLAAMGRHSDSDWSRRQFSQANSVMGFPARVFEVAVRSGNEPVASAALDAFCCWDDAWNQFKPQDIIARALLRTDGEMARSAAAVLRRHPDSAEHFAELAETAGVGGAIRRAIRPK